VLTADQTPAAGWFLRWAAQNPPIEVAADLNSRFFPPIL
jgi:hypothetical protein